MTIERLCLAAMMGENRVELLRWDAGIHPFLIVLVPEIAVQSPPEIDGLRGLVHELTIGHLALAASQKQLVDVHSD